MQYRQVVMVSALIVVTGCTPMLGGRELFQTYQPARDCVSCEKQEYWGFMSRRVPYKDTNIYYATYQPRDRLVEDDKSNISLEKIGLCYGTALATLKSGATHFRLYDKEKLGDWGYIQKPSTISGPDLFRTYTIQPEYSIRVNRHHYGSAFPYHYFEMGKPKCENGDKCAKQFAFDIKDCHFENEALIEAVEKRKGSLACVMKYNPRLLLHEVYRDEASCGQTMDGLDLPTMVSDRYIEVSEMHYWVPANDIVKKFSPLFKD